MSPRAKSDPVGYREIADRLGVPVNTVRTWAYVKVGPRSDFPAARRSGSYGVSPEYEWADILAWLERHGRSVEAPLDPHGRGRPARTPPARRPPADSARFSGDDPMRDWM